jgi:RNA polymerase sigma-70 factor (ECF subfamily)
MVDAKRAEDLDGSEPRDVALPLLVEAYGGRLLSTARRLCGNAHEAEDLVQETFLQAYRNWHQFEGRAKASTWLFTIASRLCQRMHRRKSGEPRRTESLETLLPFGEDVIGVVPREDDALEAQIRREGRERVERAIAELPDDFRMPLVLKELVGLPVEEVATILEIKPATIKTRLHRARLRIRKALEESLPREQVPQAIFSRQICLDLLNAKQEALDSGTEFEFPDQVICERCAEVFATLDLSRDICREIARGEMPEGLRDSVLSTLAAEAGA